MKKNKEILKLVKRLKGKSIDETMRNILNYNGKRIRWVNDTELIKNKWGVKKKKLLTDFGSPFWLMIYCIMMYVLGVFVGQGVCK